MRKTITSILLLLLPAALLRGAEMGAVLQNEINQPVIGSVLVTKVDFRVYRVNSGSRKKPIFHYSIDPASDTGVGGWEITELGRIPQGTKLQIVDLRKDRWFSRSTYWVRPLSPINQSLKPPPPRRGHLRKNGQPQIDLDRQTFKIISTASKRGSYAKGNYPNGNPMLNEDLITVFQSNE